MKSYMTYCVKYNKKHWVNSLLMILAITFSMVSIACIAILNDTVQSTMVSRAKQIYGRYQIAVKTDSAQEALFIQDKRIDTVGFTGAVGLTTLHDDGKRLVLEEFDASAFDLLGISLIEGRLPTQPGEAVVEEQFLKEGYIDASQDTISIPLKGTDQSVVDLSVRLVGVVKDIPATASGGYMLMLLAPDTIRAYPSLDYDMLQAYLTFQKDINPFDFVSDYGLQGQIQSINTDLLKAQGIGVTGGITDITIPIGALLAFTAALLIYAVFHLSVSNQTSYLGILRAIGAQKGQLFRIVIGEIVLLWLIAVPFSVLLSYLLSKQLAVFAAPALSVTDMHAASPDELKALLISNTTYTLGNAILSSLTGLLITFFSALYPSWKAYKASPIEAISNVAAVSVSKNASKRRFIGAARAIHCRFALRNMSRAKTRSLLTLSSIILGIITATFAYTFSFASTQSDPVMHLLQSDYSLSIEGMDAASQIPLEEAQAIEGIEGVEHVRIMRWARCEIAGMDEALSPTVYAFMKEADALLNHLLLEGRIPQKGKNEVLRVQQDANLDPYPMNELGDTISINDVLYTVTGVVSALPYPTTSIFYVGPNYILEEEAFISLYENDTVQRIDITTHPDIDSEAFNNHMENLQARYPDYNLLALTALREEYEIQSAQYKLIINSIAAIICLFGIICLANTMFVSVHLRKSEFVLLYTLGMQRGRLSRMIVIEGLLFGVIALLPGLTIGYALAGFETFASDIVRNALFVLSLSVMIMALCCLIAYLAFYATIGRKRDILVYGARQ